jgi:hypothetical protein
VVILMPESTDAEGITTPAIAAVIDVVGHVA